MSRLLRYWILGLSTGATILAEGPGLGPVQPSAPAEFLAIGEAWSGSSVNVVANRRQALASHVNEQFTAYYNPQGFMVLAKRPVQGHQWTTVTTRHRGTVADAHNAISLGIDGDGYLHVAWDHHGQPLNYARGMAPGSLELEAPTAMVGRDEHRVTYPEFHSLPDGDLLCLYRDGQSGRGRAVLNRYLTTERRWTRVHDSLIDGEGQRSPYWGLAVDRLGMLHLAWIWRDTPDVATNHDLAYARSRDGGASWESLDGGPLNVPMTLANAAYAARIPPGRNLMNSPWVTADDRGRPYLATYWSDAPESPPQFRVVHPYGESWQVETMTERPGSFTLAGAATKRPPISRGVVLVDGETERPALHLVYRDDDHGGRIVLRSTTAAGSGAWEERLLTESSVGAWEPTVDLAQWQEHREIHLLVQPAEQLDGRDDRGSDIPPTTVGVLRIVPRDDAVEDWRPIRTR